MFLSDAEREALLRVGQLADRQGRFDKNVAFSEHQVLTLRDLQDKGLVERDQGQYSLTPAGLEELHQARQAAQERIEKEREKYKADKLRFVQAIVIALITVLFGWLFSLLSGGVG